MSIADINSKIESLQKQQAADRALFERLPVTGLERGEVLFDIEMRAGEIERLEQERAEVTA